MRGQKSRTDALSQPEHAFWLPGATRAISRLLRRSERGFMQSIASTSRDNPGLAAIFGWKVWHDRATNAPRACPHCKHPLNLPRNDPGFPDLLMIRGDMLIVAELKSERGRATPRQFEWLAAFSNVRRVVVAIWRPSDWEAIERTLR